MADTFRTLRPGLDSPAERHYLVDFGSPADTVELDPMPRFLYVVESGDVEIIDADGTAITYPVVAGQELRFRAKSLGSGTTATIAAWY